MLPSLPLSFPAYNQFGSVPGRVRLSVRTMNSSSSTMTSSSSSAIKFGLSMVHFNSGREMIMSSFLFEPTNCACQMV